MSKNTKMSLKSISLVFILSFALFSSLSCSFFTYLTHADTGERNVKIIHENFSIEIGSDAYDAVGLKLSVDLDIVSDTVLVVYIDSLHVILNNKEYYYDEIFSDNNTNDGKIYTIEGDFYIHYAIPMPIRFKDEVTIFAENFIQMGDTMYDLDSLTFRVSRCTRMRLHGCQEAF